MEMLRQSGGVHLVAAVTHEELHAGGDNPRRTTGQLVQQVLKLGWGAG